MFFSWFQMTDFIAYNGFFGESLRFVLFYLLCNTYYAMSTKKLGIFNFFLFRH